MPTSSTSRQPFASESKERRIVFPERLQGDHACQGIPIAASSQVGLWNANRYNKSIAEDPRYTFGDLLIEGNREPCPYDQGSGSVKAPV